MYYNLHSMYIGMYISVTYSELSLPSFCKRCKWRRGEGRGFEYDIICYQNRLCWNVLDKATFKDIVQPKKRGSRGVPFEPF
jgi:hypothetical protein